MGFINSNGENISFECSDLIEKLKEDIIKYGGDKIVIARCKDCSGVTIYTNYDFINKDSTVKENVLCDDEYTQKITLTALLVLMEKQNEII